MQSLIPNPLHPAIVHLPIAIAVLLPAFAIGALFFIRRGTRPRTAWGITIVMLVALLFSGWASLKTGEQQEERVEGVVAERSIHTHEEAAEAFLLITAVVLTVSLTGLAPGRAGRFGRWAATLGTLAIVGAGWRVGHSGGMLVYRDGAASAYTGASVRAVGGDVQQRKNIDADAERRSRNDR